VGPGRQGAAAKVAQVHGVGEAVGGHQQGGLGQLGQLVQEIACGAIDIGAPPSHDPLVVRRAAEAVKSGPLLEAQAHPGGPGQAAHLFEPGTPGPLGHNDLLQGSLGPPKGGQNGMAAVNDLGHMVRFL
jgi:hypothetical protein